MIVLSRWKFTILYAAIVATIDLLILVALGHP